MASVNKVILIGNLGRDPELRYTPGGQAVASFPIATTSRWRDRNGQNQERTDWHNIVAWGRNAEIANEYLKKGSPVYIEGRLQTRSWEDRDGNKRYTTEIVTRQMQLLGRPAPEEGEAPPPEPEMPEAPSGGEDDLPF